MERVIFDIWIIDTNMCRIVAHDIRTEIRKLSDGGCICDIATLFDEMDRIKDEMSTLGYNAVFDIIYKR